MQKKVRQDAINNNNNNWISLSKTSVNDIHSWTENGCRIFENWASVLIGLHKWVSLWLAELITGIKLKQHCKKIYKTIRGTNEGYILQAYKTLLSLNVYHWYEGTLAGFYPPTSWIL